MSHSLHQVGADGYAVIPELLSRTEVSLFAGQLEAAALVRSRAGARHLLKVPPVMALAHDPRLVSLAASVLGMDPVPFSATLFDKSQESNWLVAWHQDVMLPMRERREIAGWGPWSVKEGIVYAKAPPAALSSVVALRLHLDDSTIDNGPLRVLPETHLNGILSQSEVDVMVARVPPVVCTVTAGGVIVLRPLLVHASSKATSPLPRRVIHIEYASATLKDYVQVPD